MSSVRLSETSYIVLGLLEKAGEATPYDLKRVAQISTVHFWTVPHTQLYTECARLAREGLLSEEREQEGRRRRTYRLTAQGLRALDRWREEPSDGSYELRDTSTLKLFFGGDPKQLAAAELVSHRRQLQEYEQLLADIGGHVPRGQLLALQCGIGHEREFIRFWSEIEREGGG